MCGVCITVQAKISAKYFLHSCYLAAERLQYTVDVDIHIVIDIDIDIGIGTDIDIDIDIGIGIGVC